MPIDEQIQAGWQRHAQDPSGVFDQLSSSAPETAQDAAAIASLLAHVGGEHLGLWRLTIERLQTLRRLPVVAKSPDTSRALSRLIAAMAYCAGDDALAAQALEEAGGTPSVQIRMLALASSALAGQGRIREASDTLLEALHRASGSKDESVSKALAITGNNLACELEELSDRTPEQSDLMKEAAHAARIHWEIAGSWVEVKIAEYRLAMTHLQSREPMVALVHAQKALLLCEENDGTAVDRFFPHLAAARAHHALGNTGQVERTIQLARAEMPPPSDNRFDYFESELDRALSDLELVES